MQKKEKNKSRRRRSKCDWMAVTEVLHYSATARHISVLSTGLIGQRHPVGNLISSHLLFLICPSFLATLNRPESLHNRRQAARHRPC